MSTPRFTPEELDRLRELAFEWGKIVSKRAFGDDGPGLDVDFTTREQIATVAAQGITEGTLQQMLAQQAQKGPEQAPCPPVANSAPPSRTNAPSPHRGPRSSRPNGSPTVLSAGGTFSPLRTALGLDEHAFSSSVLECIVTAAARFSSFRDAACAVPMAGITIRVNQVRRLAHEVGHELIAARDRKVVEHRRRQLEPRTAVIPEAVVVEVEGGRIRTRVADAGPGVHEAQNKEDKVACRATLTGPTFAADPCPEPPQSFQCPRRVPRRVARMKDAAGEAPAQETPGESASAVPSGWSRIDPATPSRVPEPGRPAPPVLRTTARLPVPQTRYAPSRIRGCPHANRGLTSLLRSGRVQRRSGNTHGRFGGGRSRS